MGVIKKFLREGLPVNTPLQLGFVEPNIQEMYCAKHQVEDTVAYMVQVLKCRCLEGATFLDTQAHSSQGETRIRNANAYIQRVTRNLRNTRAPVVKSALSQRMTEARRVAGNVANIRTVAQSRIFVPLPTEKEILTRASIHTPEIRQISNLTKESEATRTKDPKEATDKTASTP